MSVHEIPAAGYSRIRTVIERRRLLRRIVDLVRPDLGGRDEPGVNLGPPMGRRTFLFAAALLSACGGGTSSKPSADSCPSAVSDPPVVAAPVSSKLKPYIEAWGKQFTKLLPTCELLIVDPSQGERCVSEAIGHGMLIAVEAGDQAMFDALYETYRGYADTRPDKLSPWLIDSEGKIQDSNNAIDADIDVAHALLKAAERFGDNKYIESALGIIGLIGDYALQQNYAAVYLLPSSQASNFIKGSDFIVNPSYLKVDAFREFAEVDKNHDWLGAVDSSYDLIGKAIDAFGFVPDWVGVDINGGVFELTKEYCAANYLFSPGQRAHIFGFDAVRVLWNLAKDAPNRPQAKELLTILLDNYSWAAETEVADAWSENAYHNEIAAAAFAVAAAAVSYPTAQEYTAEFEKFQKEDYYGNWPGAKEQCYNQSLALLMHFMLV